MVIDLRQNAGISGNIIACYLAEDSARITSPEFKVYIPTIMESIDKNKTDYTESIDAKTNLNETGTTVNSTVNCQGYLVAKSIHPYRIRHDGWIPKFAIENVTAENGTVEDQSANSTNGVTDPGGPGPHTHSITKKLQLMTNKLTSIVFNKLIVTTSTGVDYQELNNKYIKRGHLMYGCFVEGLQNQFVIIAIDNVVPYKAQQQPGENADNPDTSFDGGAQNVPNG